MGRVIGVVMPATWSFDEMKRLSGLDVLRGKDEKAEASVNNEGRGLYKKIERENDQNIADAQTKIRNYKSDAEKSLKDFEKDMDQYQKDLMSRVSTTKPTAPALGDVPTIQKASQVPEDLSTFIDFLHPWGSHLIDSMALLTMLFVLLSATGIALRMQDI
jgi:hypothetical protein